MAIAYALVLGSSRDTQLRTIVDALKVKVPTVFLDHDEPADCAIDFGRGGGFALRLDQRRLPPPAAVWCRLKIRTVLSHWSPETVPEYVTRAEWRGFLNGLALALGDRLVQRSWAAEHKVHQLAVAGRAGFGILPSRIFVGKAEGLSFARRTPDVVLKPVEVKNCPSLAGDIDRYVLLTPVETSSAEIEAADEVELRRSPAMLQRRVRHGRELRVIAFRERAYTYEVRPRIEERLRVEDRAIQRHVYRLIETPAHIQGLTTRYLELMGLEYGAFDLLEEGGVPYFLECNPEGQWSAANGINHQELADYFAERLAARVRAADLAPAWQAEGEAV
jgi:hypothetical protein